MDSNFSNRYASKNDILEEEDDEDLDLSTTVKNVSRTITDDQVINRKIRSNLNDDNENNSTRLVSKPNVDSQDKLWTEIDALDDVKKLAAETNLYDGFSPEFEDQLKKVRESHTKLLQVMKNRHARLEEMQRHEVNEALIDKQNVETQTSDSEVISGDNIKGDAVPAKSNLEPAANNENTDANLKNYHPTANPTFADYIRPADEGMDIIEEDKYIQEMVEIIRELRT